MAGSMGEEEKVEGKAARYNKTSEIAELWKSQSFGNHKASEITLENHKALEIAKLQKSQNFGDHKA